jgi:hypothetical protein
MTKPLSVATFAAASLVACGGENPVAPTILPSVAGRYEAWNMWQVQFQRAHDGYSGTFYCPGSLTLVQSGDRLTGFAVVGEPCPPSSFELVGSVTPERGIVFTGAGPRPPEGQCPAPSGAAYTGLATDVQVSLRATANLDCPGPGEGRHRFDYIVTAYKQS